MSCPSVIRIADAADFDEVWRLLVLSHGEGGIFTIAKDKSEWLIKRALSPETIHPNDTRSRGVIGVIGEAGKLEGLAFLVISSMWYSHDLFIEELVVFVDPEHRKSDHARVLIEWMQRQVPETGLPLISGVVSTERTEAKCRLYRRKLPKAGEFFLVMPKQGNNMISLSAGTS